MLVPTDEDGDALPWIAVEDDPTPDISQDPDNDPGNDPQQPEPAEEAHSIETPDGATGYDLETQSDTAAESSAPTRRRSPRLRKQRMILKEHKLQQMLSDPPDSSFKGVKFSTTATLALYLQGHPKVPLQSQEFKVEHGDDFSDTDTDEDVDNLEPDRNKEPPLVQPGPSPQEHREPSSNVRLKDLWGTGQLTQGAEDFQQQHRLQCDRDITLQPSSPKCWLNSGNGAVDNSSNPGGNENLSVMDEESTKGSPGSNELDESNPNEFDEPSLSQAPGQPQA